MIRLTGKFMLRETKAAQQSYKIVPPTHNSSPNYLKQFKWLLVSCDNLTKNFSPHQSVTESNVIKSNTTAIPNDSSGKR